MIRFIVPFCLSLFTLFPPSALSLSERPPKNSQGCSHVEFLTKDSNKLNEKVPPGYLPNVEPPGLNQRDVANMALNSLTPFVCKSVRYITFVSKVNGDARAFVDRRYPGTILVIATRGMAAERSLGEPLRDFPDESEEDRAALVADKLKIWPETVKSIIHEAIHCAVHLLQSVNDQKGAAEMQWEVTIKGVNIMKPLEKWLPGYLKESLTEYAYHEEEFPDRVVWPAAVESDAKRIVKANQAVRDLGNEWKRIQQQFFKFRFLKGSGSVLENAERGLSVDFWDGEGDPPSELVGRKPPLGFMSYYATKSPGEDLAESAAWPTFIWMFKKEKRIRLGEMDHVWRGTFLEFGDNPMPKSEQDNIIPSWDYENGTACKMLSETTVERIPSGLNSVYLKLKFLVDLELISRQAFDACIGSGEIKLKRIGTNVNGFQSFRGVDLEDPIGEFKEDVKYTGTPSTILSAKGKATWVQENAVLMQLKMVGASYRRKMPRGIYRIDTGCLKPPDANPSFGIYSTDKMRRWLSACDGVVVVLSSTEKRLEGFVVVFAYFKRIVPERPKKPHIITFVFEES